MDTSLQLFTPFYSWFSWPCGFVSHASTTISRMSKLDQHRLDREGRFLIVSNQLSEWHTMKKYFAMTTNVPSASKTTLKQTLSPNFHATPSTIIIHSASLTGWEMAKPNAHNAQLISTKRKKMTPKRTRTKKVLIMMRQKP